MYCTMMYGVVVHFVLDGVMLMYKSKIEITVVR